MGTGVKEGEMEEGRRVWGQSTMLVGGVSGVSLERLCWVLSGVEGWVLCAKGYMAAACVRRSLAAPQLANSDDIASTTTTMQVHVQAPTGGTA